MFIEELSNCLNLSSKLFHMSISDRSSLQLLMLKQQSNFGMNW